MTSSVPSLPSRPLIEALVSFHKTVPSINKTANAQYGKFADLETVLSTVTPHLICNGLVVSQTFEPSQGLEPILITKLLHVSGAELESRLPMIIGKGRNALHDFGSSCTYLKRYALLAMLGLTADMDIDGDFADEKPSSKSEPKKIATVKDESDQQHLPWEKRAIPTQEREDLKNLIEKMPANKREKFLQSYRLKFGLGPDANVWPTVLERQHQAWIKEHG